GGFGAGGLRRCGEAGEAALRVAIVAADRDELPVRARRRLPAAEPFEDPALPVEPLECAGVAAAPGRQLSQPAKSVVEQTFVDQERHQEEGPFHEARPAGGDLYQRLGGL